MPAHANQGKHQSAASIGPQYPFLFHYTLFEPTSAKLPPDGVLTTDLLFSATNIYAISVNSFVRLREREQRDSGQFKLCNNFPNAPASYLWNCKSEGYSVFLDGELQQRRFRASWSITNSLALGYAYREIRFSTGILDPHIKNFHNNVGLASSNREWEDNHHLEIYLWDNEEEKAVFQLTSETPFLKLAETLSLQWQWLNLSKRHHGSFQLSSNFNDHVFWNDLNEVATSSKKDQKPFDDYNVALLYSTIWKNLFFHAALAQTQVKNPYFSKSPRSIKFFFLGLNWDDEPFQWIVQDLQYSSVFPGDSQEPLNRDNNEMTMRSRVIILQDNAWFYAVLCDITGREVR